MNNRSKNILYSIILVASVFAVYGCQSVHHPVIWEPMRIEGQTMGTAYQITYFDRRNRDFKASVDSLLGMVNRSINTYDTASEVSRFNKSTHGIAVHLPYLAPPIVKAQEIFTASHGAFDLTVMPLVNAWGFGPGKSFRPDSTEIDSILTFVGLDKIQLTSDSIHKQDPRVQLDFGGIGQGYGADVITDFLKTKGITNMLVELGGEGMAVGKNLKTNKAWQIGILDPNSTLDHQFFKAYVGLTDRSFTTSGNYFNYYEMEGIKYSHTIDPETGFPSRQSILSASVFSSDCTTADAWATAFMVMGHEKAIELLRIHPELDALLIFSNKDGDMELFSTPAIRNNIKIESTTTSTP
jgi:FAD:protein FMN transferase